MTNSKDFNLVNGTFNEEEATEILNHLFSENIKFFVNRKFSLDVRFGISCAYSEKQISELRKKRKEILSMIKEAQLMGKTVMINSDIQIRLVDDQPIHQASKSLIASLQ